MNHADSHYALAAAVKMYQGILEDADRIQKLQAGEVERLRKALDTAERMRREQSNKAMEAEADSASFREVIDMVVKGIMGIGVQHKPWTLEEVRETLAGALAPLPPLVTSPDAVRQQEAAPVDARERSGDGGPLGEAHAEGQGAAGGSEEAGAQQVGEVGKAEHPTFLSAPGREIPERFRSQVPVLGRTPLRRPPAGTPTVERLTGPNRQG